jgi:CRISPR-associated protein Cas2
MMTEMISPPLPPSTSTSTISMLPHETPPVSTRPTAQKYYVVSYDVPDDRRRNRMAKTLLGFGERVQDSVFECLLDAGQMHELRRRLDKLIDANADSVRFYNLGAVTSADVEVQGIGSVTKVPAVYIV